MGTPYSERGKEKFKGLVSCIKRGFSTTYEYLALQLFKMRVEMGERYRHFHRN
jgi:hypothetical protein